MSRLTDSEWRVLTALWDSGDAALGEVAASLRPDTGWSRNTVLTYLTRMEAKGLVAIDKTVSPHRYQAALDRQDCQRQERQSFLRRVYQGSAGDLVSAFLKEDPISPQEREELRRLLDEMEV